MIFASDNLGPVHPNVMAALARANDGYAMPYGADKLMEEVRVGLRSLFEAPEAAIYLVATGTAANALSLATLSQSWQALYCSSVAHIHIDECNAPEFYTGGAKLIPIKAADGRIAPNDLQAAIDATIEGDVHRAQRGALSLTNETELGTVYSVAEIKALTEIAKSHDMPVHLDGARLANAIAALGCTPAELTWKAGVDVLSFGGTKNGLMGVEAVIIFDPSHAWEFELRRKRAAHLFSKHRYLSAQMVAYLEGDLWRDMALSANQACARLADGMRGMDHVTLDAEPAANIIFARWPRAAHQRLHDAGAVYYIMDGPLEGDDPKEMLLARLVTDWSSTSEAVDQFLEILRG